MTIYWRATYGSGRAVIGKYTDLKTIAGASRRVYREHPSAVEWEVSVNADFTF